MRLISIILLVICSKTAFACDCPKSPLAYRTQSSEAVFLGRIISYGTNSIDLQVIETFKGHLDAQISIPTGKSMCDYFLLGVGEKGSRFLVFMSIKDGKPSVNQCLGSALESEAAEEIRALRSAR